MIQDEGKKLEQIGVRVSPRLKSRISKAAREQSRSASGWARLVIEEKLRSDDPMVVQDVSASYGSLDPLDQRLVETFSELDRQDEELTDAVLALIGRAAESPEVARIVKDLAAALARPGAGRGGRAARTPARRRKKGNA